MDATEALALLNTALGLIAQLGTLAPQLVANYDAVKAGLASDDPQALADQIATTHAAVQDMDAKLQALRS